MFKFAVKRVLEVEFLSSLLELFYSDSSSATMPIMCLSQARLDLRKLADAPMRNSGTNKLLRMVKFFIFFLLEPQLGFRGLEVCMVNFQFFCVKEYGSDATALGHT